MPVDKIDNTNQGTRINVLYPNHIKPIEFPSVTAFVKKMFLGRKIVAKRISEQIRDVDETEYQGYKITKIHGKYN
jgi:hypothetical protein